MLLNIPRNSKSQLVAIPNKQETIYLIEYNKLVYKHQRQNRAL